MQCTVYTAFFIHIVHLFTLYTVLAALFLNIRLSVLAVSNYKPKIKPTDNPQSRLSKDN